MHAGGKKTPMVWMISPFHEGLKSQLTSLTRLAHQKSEITNQTGAMIETNVFSFIGNILLKSFPFTNRAPLVTSSAVVGWRFVFFAPKGKQTIRIEWTAANPIWHAEIDPDTNILRSHPLVWTKVTVYRGTIFMNKIVPEFRAVTLVNDGRLIRPAQVVIGFSCGNHFSIVIRSSIFRRIDSCRRGLASIHSAP